MKKECNFLYIFLGGIYFIAIFPKIIQMFFILSLLLYFVFRHKKIYIDKKIIPFILCFFVHLLSIILYSLTNNSIRIAAALNTASLWLIGGLLYSFISNENINKAKFEKKCYIICLVMATIGLIMLVFKTLHFDNITILSRRLIGVDWLNGLENYRLLGFLEYSNLIVIMFFLIHPFSIKYVLREKSKIFQLLYLVITVLPVMLTNSRIGIILSAIYYIFLFPNIISINKKSKILITIFFAIFVGCCLILYNQQIVAKVNTILHSRESSTSMRSLIYESSINITLKKSPLLGIGVKEYIGDYPLGSHSTFIGFFYKTGIIGLFFALIGFINIFFNYFKKNDLSVFVSFCCVIATLCVEDLDGANWIIILFFIVTSIFINKYEVRKNGNINYSPNL